MRLIKDTKCQLPLKYKCKNNNLLKYPTFITYFKKNNMEYSEIRRFWIFTYDYNAWNPVFVDYELDLYKIRYNLIEQLVKLIASTNQ